MSNKEIPLEPTFPSLLRTNVVKPVPVGNKIYKWKYLDKKGVIQYDEKNVYEEIQSYRGQVDFKEQIQKGEFILNDTKGAYMDISELGNDNVSADNYLASLRAKFDKDVADYQAQARKTSESVTESGKIDGVNKEEKGETK